MTDVEVVRVAEASARSGLLSVPRTRGATSGVLLVLLGLWGALIPFIGPYFEYSYTAEGAWQFTMPRLVMHILPGAAALIGGLVIAGASNVLGGHAGGWLAAAGGGWFIVGPSLSRLWNDGQVYAGSPMADTTLGTVAQEIGLFYGVGAVILLLSAMALGRFSVLQPRTPKSAAEKEAA